MGAGGKEAADLDLRRALTGLQELLVLSMVMFDHHDVEQVLTVLAGSVRSVTRCDLVQVRLHRQDGWVSWPGPDADIPDPDRFGSRPVIEPDGPAWRCTSAIAAVSGLPGQLVLRSPVVPDTQQLFVIERLGHLLGAALADAELHERDRHQARELDRINNQLARAVAGLQHREAVQQVFTRLVGTGSDADLVAALTRLTGRTAVMRDGFGHETVRVRHDDVPALPPPPGTTLSPSQLTRTESTLVATIGGSPNLGTIALDLAPDEDAEDPSFALHYAGIALGVIKRQEQAVVQAENRLSRELVEDLLEGIETNTARARSLAQGHDLRVPHDVILVAWPGQGVSVSTDHDSGSEQVRRAVERQRVAFLLAPRPDMVVVIAHQGVEINKLYQDLNSGPEPSHGQVAIGEPANTPQEIPHAYAQALRALSALQQSSAPHGATAHANLGVLRILAVEENAREVDDLIEDWLDALIKYDAEHGTEFLLTLAVYLDQGGSYADTARALFIHRNTLRYRLRRITEISRHDMSDVDTRLNLHVATRAWRLRRAGPGSTLARRPH
jgi:hypothetical protein